jgi:hypothetical protein
LRLKNRILHSDADTADYHSETLHPEDGEWVDLSMSSFSPLDSDFTRSTAFTEPHERSETADRAGAKVHDPAIRRALNFLHRMVARISAIGLRRGGMGFRRMARGGPRLLPPGYMDSTADSATGTCSGLSSAGGLAPRSLRTFFTYVERRSSRFTVRY